MKRRAALAGGVLLLSTIASCGYGATTGSAPGSRATGNGHALFSRAFARLFAQPRFEVAERIVADPSIDQRALIRWIAPDRLRTEIYGPNVHVGRIGCIEDNFWICGPDTVAPRPEVRSIVMHTLFPQGANSEYCCLHHLRFQAYSAGPGQSRTIVVQALGDPWLYPPGCQGCGIPGSYKPTLESKHHRAVITLDALDSTVSFRPWRQTNSVWTVHVQARAPGTVRTECASRRVSVRAAPRAFQVLALVTAKPMAAIAASDAPAARMHLPITP